MNRPLRSAPSWVLRLALKLPFYRRLWGEAWLELWYRDVYEPALAECNDESGPYLVAPINGVQ